MANEQKDYSNLKTVYTKIGVMWTKQKKDESYFWSGKLGNTDLVMFENQKKEKDTDPDYVLFVTTQIQKG